MSRADRFDNYQTITARFDSTGACGHPIKQGDKIGWNRRVKKVQCAECWHVWQAENAEADYLERSEASYLDFSEADPW